MAVRRRRSDRSGRGALHSPGRPSVARREERGQFWVAIAAGQSNEEAAVVAGVSPPVGVRWFRQAGGLPPSHLSQSSKPMSGRYLLFPEREQLALLRAQGHGVREIARRRPRSVASCAAMRPRAAAVWNTGPSTRNGMQTGPPVARSWRSTPRCGVTCRIACPARSSPRAGRRYTVRS